MPQTPAAGPSFFHQIKTVSADFLVNQLGDQGSGKIRYTSPTRDITAFLVKRKEPLQDGYDKLHHNITPKVQKSVDFEMGYRWQDRRSCSFPRFSESEIPHTFLSSNSSCPWNLL